MWDYSVGTIGILCLYRLRIRKKYWFNVVYTIPKPYCFEIWNTLFKTVDTYTGTPSPVTNVDISAMRAA